MPDPRPILPETLILPETTISGRGKLSALLSECRRFGARGLVIHGASHGPRLRKLDIPGGMAVQFSQHPGGEPTLLQVSQLIEIARGHQAMWVAGIGGGSVLDLAKAVAALTTAPRPLTAYHDGAAIEGPGLVFVAVPTTAGTGAEATINSVLTNEATGIKKSIRSPGMIARVVILDPELLGTCPSAVIAASGMDALTQGIEAFTSRYATVLSDHLALESVSLIARHLESVFANPGADAAGALLTGSYLGGIALSFARLGVVHGLAHPLGVLYHVPHGLVCATCLPYALHLNREAYGDRYDTLSHAVGEDLISFVDRLTARLGLVSPFSGKPLKDPELIIRETLASGSTRANPRTITRPDVEWILARLFRVGSVTP